MPKPATWIFTTVVAGLLGINYDCLASLVPPAATPSQPPRPAAPRRVIVARQAIDQQATSQRKFATQVGNSNLGPTPTTATPTLSKPTFAQPKTTKPKITEPKIVRVAASGSNWQGEAQVGVFYVHQDFPWDSRQPWVTQLSRLQQQFQQRGWGRLEIKSQIVHVFVFGKRTTYEEYLRHYFPDAPRRRAVYIRRGHVGMIYAYRHANLAEDLRHEATHGLLQREVSGLPVWLDEGLAEYFEEANTNRLRHAEHSARRKELWSHRPPTLPQLDRMRDAGRMSVSDYGAAWEWVTFLLHGPEPVRREFADYFNCLRRSQPTPLLSRRLAAKVPDYRQQFRQFWQRVDTENTTTTPALSRKSTGNRPVLK